MKERIERIGKMEALLNRLTQVMNQAEKAIMQLEDSQAALKELTDYYTSSLWMADFEADERGEIPAHVPRGVLSEDGVYDLLWQHRCLTEKMAALGKLTEE